MVLTECQKRAYANYRAKNREKINEISRRCYQRNKIKYTEKYHATKDPFSKAWIVLCKIQL